MKTMKKKMTYRASDPPVCPRLCLCPIPTPSTCGTRTMWWSHYRRTTVPRWALCCCPPSPTSPPSSPHPAPTTAPHCPTVLGRHLPSHGTSEKKTEGKKVKLGHLIWFLTDSVRWAQTKENIQGLESCTRKRLCACSLHADVTFQNRLYCANWYYESDNMTT